MSLLDEDLSIKTDYHVLIKNMYLLGSCEDLNNFPENCKSILKIGTIILERTTNMFYVYGFNEWVNLKELLENAELEECEKDTISGILCCYFSLMSEVDNYPKNIFINS